MTEGQHSAPQSSSPQGLWVLNLWDLCQNPDSLLWPCSCFCLICSESNGVWESRGSRRCLTGLLTVAPGLGSCPLPGSLGQLWTSGQSADLRRLNLLNRPVRVYQPTTVAFAMTLAASTSWVRVLSAKRLFLYPLLLPPSMRVVGESYLWPSCLWEFSCLHLHS